MTPRVEPNQVDAPRRFTAGAFLARNVIWNTLGQVSPVAVAIFTIPALIHGLGTDRFGLLAVIWVVIGYFSVFDFGLGRALTQAVAERLGSRHDQEVPHVVWSALIVMAVLGLVGLVAIGVLSSWLMGPILKVPGAIAREGVEAFQLLALSVPIVLTTAGLRGVLEAEQRFDLLNSIRLPLGLFTYIGPLSVLPFSRSLTVIVGVLLAGRIVAWLAHVAICVHVVPELLGSMILDWQAVRRLLRFGSWITVSNLIGPLMVYLDRFVIGAAVSVAAVAYYATPYEVVTKLLLVPFAVAGVLFPTFASTVQQDQAAFVAIFVRGVKCSFAMVFPVVLLVVSFAHEGLAYWVDAGFADHSAAVLQILAVGVLMNGLAQIPFALLQGAGRPDLTARLHIAEVPFYLMLLWVLLETMGIVGVAFAWLVRATVDAALLFWLANRIAPVPVPGAIRGISSMGLALIGLALVAVLPGSTRVAATGLMLVAFAGGLWFGLTSLSQRTERLKRIKSTLQFYYGVWR